MTADEPALELSAEPLVKRRTRGADWWGELKGLFWLVLAVLGFHSFVAKPFYIPSESMLPGLEVGDRLVVNKFAYGWSFVSPTIPNPAAIFRSLVLGRHEDSWSVQLPAWHGRLFGRMPERGDVVIVTPPGTNNDYIKRVIGLPGDRLEVRGGTVILNGKPLPRGPLHYVDLRDYGATPTPTGEQTCDPAQYRPDTQVHGSDGLVHCRLSVVTETLPSGRTYDTVELGPSPGDDYPNAGAGASVEADLTPDRNAIVVPAGHVFLMGDNRDRSADSRYPLSCLGLGGPVPWENVGGRAEFITFSLDGTTTLNPLTWFGAFRGGRAGHSLHPAER